MQVGLVAFWFARLKVSLQQEINVFYAKLHSFNRYAFQGIGMQEQQNKFLIDADIGDDDVTLPSLPAVKVPIIENNKVASATQTSAQSTSIEQSNDAQNIQDDEPKKVVSSVE